MPTAQQIAAYQALGELLQEGHTLLAKTPVLVKELQNWEAKAKHHLSLMVGIASPFYEQLLAITRKVLIGGPSTQEKIDQHRLKKLDEQLALIDNVVKIFRKEYERAAIPNAQKQHDEHLEVFLSWSKPVSHKVAKALKEWFPTLFPHAKCWLSSVDIHKGKPWFGSISEQLAKSEVCIICVTPENLNSHWLMYEAGAIAHAKQGKLVCPLLFKASHGEIDGLPLGQFQATVTEKEDMRLLLQSMNREISTPIPIETLDAAFQSKWPKLQRALNKIVVVPSAVALVPKPKPNAKQQLTNENDIIAELQEYVRNNFRALSTSKIVYVEVDKELNLLTGSTKKLIRSAAAKQGFEVETWGEVQAIFKHHKVHKSRTY